MFSFTYRGKKIRLEVREMKGLMRGIGLMFRTSKTCNLLFAFSKPSRVALTSWFVFFPFVAIWLDKNKKFIEFRYISPFEMTIIPSKPASYLLELPINSKNRKILKKLSK